jgi:hypothetical protein
VLPRRHSPPRPIAQQSWLFEQLPAPAKRSHASWACAAVYVSRAVQSKKLCPTPFECIV